MNSLAKPAKRVIDIFLLLILATIILYGLLVLTSPCGRPRMSHDASLKSDIGQLATALEGYYSDHGRYPESLDSLTLTKRSDRYESAYLRRLPTVPTLCLKQGRERCRRCSSYDDPVDVSPKPGEDYSYLVNNEASGFAVYAQLTKPDDESKPYYAYAAINLGTDDYRYHFGQISLEEVRNFIGLE